MNRSSIAAGVTMSALLLMPLVALAAVKAPAVEPNSGFTTGPLPSWASRHASSGSIEHREFHKLMVENLGVWIEESKLSMGTEEYTQALRSFLVGQGQGAPHIPPLARRDRRREGVEGSTQEHGQSVCDSRGHHTGDESDSCRLARGERFHTDLRGTSLRRIKAKLTPDGRSGTRPWTESLTYYSSSIPMRSGRVCGDF